MLINATLLFVLLFVSIGATLDHWNKDTIIELVHVIHRHGDRTPDTYKNFPADPLANNTFYPMGRGGLVNRGKLRMHRLGAMLRRRYDSFLGDIWTPGSVDVLTTGIERTKASALMLLALLYPPSHSQRWAKLTDCNSFDSQVCRVSDGTGILAALWQPITFHYENLATDPLLGGVCSAFIAERNKVASSKKNQSRLREFIPLMEYLSEKTLTNITSTRLIFLLYDTIIAENAYGVTHPLWVSPIWPQIKEAADFEFELMYESIDNGKRGGGVIVDKILSDSFAKLQGSLEPHDRKLFEYSAHDYSVAGVLAALGGEEHLLLEHGQRLRRSQPIFGSAVIIEVHRIIKTGKGAIKIFYYNQQDPHPRSLKIAGCGLLCPLEQVLDLTNSTRISLTNLIKLCPVP